MRIGRWLALVALAACTRGEATSSLGRVVIDSLPDGTPRVITELATGWVDTNGWKLVEEARIVGGTEGIGELIDAQDVALGEDGSIYIAETSPSVIKKYDREGKFIRLIGHEGQGPGEFQAAFLSVYRGKLIVHDPRSQRTSAFDTSGTFIRSWPSVCCYYGPIPTDSAGNVGLSTMAPRVGAQGDPQPYSHLVRWYSSDSLLVDTTLVPSGPEVKRWVVKEGKNNRMSTTIPWMPRQIQAFLPDRRMLYGFGDSYRIAVTDETGADTTALFGRAWTPAMIPEADRRAEHARRVAETSKYYDETVVRNGFQFSDIPTTAPAYDWIALDGRGDIWTRTPLPTDTTRSLFDVFDPSHRWLGQVSGGRLLRSWGMKLTGDRMVGFGEDDQGNPMVVVYRIERGGAGE
jgi:hypothetical protein